MLFPQAVSTGISDAFFFFLPFNNKQYILLNYNFIFQINHVFFVCRLYAQNTEAVYNKYIVNTNCQNSDTWSVKLLREHL